MEEFANDYFYVDDYLASFTSEEEAVSVLKNTQEILYLRRTIKITHKYIKQHDRNENFHPADLVSYLNTLKTSPYITALVLFGI